MTIGIAAHGPNAGLAVYRSLRATERVGTGSIGGFAAFGAISADGVGPAFQRAGCSNARGGYGGWNTHPVGRASEGRRQGVGKASEVGA